MPDTRPGSRPAGCAARTAPVAVCGPEGGQMQVIRTTDAPRAPSIRVRLRGVLGVVVLQVGNGYGVVVCCPSVGPADSIQSRPSGSSTDDRRIEHRASLIDESIVIAPWADMDHRQPLDARVERDPRALLPRPNGGLLVRGASRVHQASCARIRDPRAKLAFVASYVVSVQLGGAGPRSAVPGWGRCGVPGPGSEPRRGPARGRPSDLTDAGGDRRQLDEQRRSDQARGSRLSGSSPDHSPGPWTRGGSGTCGAGR